jgi:hypothetical protein
MMEEAKRPLDIMIGKLQSKFKFLEKLIVNIKLKKNMVETSIIFNNIKN